MTGLSKLPEDSRQKAKRSKLPTWHSPMLAKLTDERFSDKSWIYERKFDGERCLALSKNNSVTLYSRNHKKLNHTYPEIVEALTGQKNTGFFIDGEIVAFEGNRTSFERLQNRMQIKREDEALQSSTAVYYYVFDVLYAHGHDLTGVALEDRKRVLKGLLRYSNRIRLTPYRNESGESYFKSACRKGWEGLIAKDRASDYSHGRSSDWLKFKCVHEQELVIGGFTEPRGTRIGFGALLVGYYDGKRLKYAGKVGTGYDDRTLRRLGGKLAGLETDKSPFSRSVMEKNVHWVRPQMVAQIGFTEWTRDNKLRHPRFKGLRRDKSPREVVRERSGG